MKLIFKISLSAFLCIIIGALYGLIGSLFDVFPFFALIACVFTHGAVTIISHQKTKKIMFLGFLMGALTFYFFISTGYLMFQSSISDQLVSLAEEQNHTFTAEELEEATVYYTDEYLIDTTGHRGNIGFILLETKSGFFSTSKLKSYDSGDEIQFVGILIFIAKFLIMVLGPGFMVLEKDKPKENSVGTNDVTDPVSE